MIHSFLKLHVNFGLELIHFCNKMNHRPNYNGTATAMVRNAKMFDIALN
jgi:hypothetical protein